ncbi:glycoside hydrolase, family 31 [Thozetella sp. PMI_491]|nr:glycoside hydrolase, family 31 [Thozetella sp. PMI_491]
MALLARFLLAAASLSAGVVLAQDCNYQASNVVTGTNSLTADLKLTGSCSQYPGDNQGALVDLKLLVEYQTDSRLHVKVYDGGLNMYQVQESVLPRPTNKNPSSSQLKFNIVNNPFSFSVVRVSNGEVLFDTSGSALVYQSQYIRLRTKLPSSPNLYGFGENSDSFRLETTGYHRTFWNAESPFLPRKQNLYGSHPMYLDHRAGRGTHGVFLLNANGMDVNINVDSAGQQYLEYNTIGGVLDFYFFAGSSPLEVSRQYAEATGYAAMVPYWAFGYHQCKYGYESLQRVKAVVANYSTAGIPLEVMWGDIDYMNGRQDFTTDPTNYPTADYRTFINTLHQAGQKYVMMLDPGIHRVSSYGPYSRGTASSVFLKAAGGSDYRGKQWAGEVVWPDWFAANTQSWWTNEIQSFFDPTNGLNIDGLWNDMNEASNFCGDINCNPSAKRSPSSSTQDLVRSVRFRAEIAARATCDFQGQQQKGLPSRDLFNPRYRIQNHLGDISASTIYTNITNADCSVQYDTHNLYGLMMATATRNALLTRRPGKRPFVLSRSTFASAGSKMAHWFGDNYSAWDDYRFSIAEMLTFTSVHNMPMVGSDVCGFNGNVQEKMCARWAMLGAFQPFYRNHADISAPAQEFYLFPLVTDAAKKAIAARYKLLDYIYLSLRRASDDGTPIASPLFFKYPNDANTFGIQYQWFLGDALLVSPVHDDDSQSVTFYLPDDIFYDFWTLAAVRGTGANVTLNNVAFTDIPVHYRGGTIVAMRSDSAMTTAEVRKKNFTVVIPVGLDGKAKGSLYLDDGETINGAYSDIQLEWDGTTFKTDGVFGLQTNLVIEKVILVTQQGSKTQTGSWTLNSKVSFTI